ncbi:MAG TPA: DoxX family protein [Roseiarcus sp.]|nr:DoxX family protein [Roseiarcus sp.]
MKLKAPTILPPAWAPYTQALLRIMIGLLFVEHGTVKLFGFPTHPPGSFSAMLIFEGLMELVGGLLIVAGFMTRPVAFILSGYMAAAYFIVFAPMSFFPSVNHGGLSIMYSFVFLYLAAAGPGAWAVDDP